MAAAAERALGNWCNGTLRSTTGWREEGQCATMVRMIDDATSWSWGRFVERDATPHNMGVLWEYLEKNGRMVDVYTDRDSMFTVPPRPAESESEQQREADRLTQLGRGHYAIWESARYWLIRRKRKGRIERSFLTAQDRLVKHLRLAKVTHSGKRPMRFWRKNIGRNGIPISLGRWRTFPISIAR